jgi:hypothetical protein
VFESDIEEAAAGGSSTFTPSGQLHPGVPDMDEMMVDTLEREQQAEIDEYEAMMASIHDSGSVGQGWGWQHGQKPPDPPHLSDDDDDYDALFMDYLSQEHQTPREAPASSGEMDLS